MGRYLTVNKLVEVLKKEKILQDDDILNVYFEDFNESKLYSNKWSVAPIGYTIIRDDIVKQMDFYDIKVKIPDMCYLSLPITSENNPKDLSITEKKLNKIVIVVKEVQFRRGVYYRSVLKVVNNPTLHKKLLENFRDSRIRYIEQLCDVPDEPVPDID